MDVLSTRRFTERSGPSMPSVERPHIYKDPPKAIWTRKKERVSEADVTWAYRPDGAASDPTRINEAIQRYSRGVNPSVKVSYSNVGAGSRTTHLKHNQPGALYKLDTVRPPLFPVETTHSLSNPRTHQNITVETNPGLVGGQSTNTLANDVDRIEIMYSIASERASGMKVDSTKGYKLEQPEPMSAKWAINEQPLQYTSITNPGMKINTDAFVEREESAYGTIIRPKTSAFSNPSLNIEAEPLNNRGEINRGLIDKVKAAASSNPSLNINSEFMTERGEINRGLIDRVKTEGRTNVKLFALDDNQNRDGSGYARGEKVLDSIRSTHQYNLFQGADSGDIDIDSTVKKDIILSNIRPNFSVVVYDPSNHVATEVAASIKQKENIAIQASMGAPITFTAENGNKIKLKDYTWTAVNTNVGSDQVILTVHNPDVTLERNMPIYATNSRATAPTDITDIQYTENSYNLDSKILNKSLDSKINLSSQYNSDRHRDLQDLTKLNKELLRASFENKAGFIPTYERQSNFQSGQYVKKDMNIKRNVARESFARLFE